MSINQSKPLNLFQVKLGILGGGQLAKYLSEEANKLGIETYILSKSKSDPAAQTRKNWLSGDPQQPEYLESLCNLVDIIIFESEFVTICNWKSLSQKHNCQFFPNPDLMKTLSDRNLQKNWLIKNEIPTAEFILPQHRNDLVSFFGEGIVLKTRTHGYDGYGTQIITDSSLITPEIQFEQIICERRIPFLRELALTCFRDIKGNITFFPLVESFQKNAQCYWVKGPTQNSNTDALKVKVKKALSTHNYVGSITFELFETKNGQLLVNEVAPRVHNTAHHSLTSTSFNQFKLHLMCVLGIKIPQTIKLKSNGFAMVNLIGTGSSQVTFPQDLIMEETFWYNKSENKSRRKLGHINSLGNTPNQALQKALTFEKGFQL